jgi:hypothetical protein
MGESMLCPVRVNRPLVATVTPSVIQCTKGADCAATLEVQCLPDWGVDTRNQMFQVEVGRCLGSLDPPPVQLLNFTSVYAPSPLVSRKPSLGGIRVC